MAKGAFVRLSGSHALEKGEQEVSGAASSPLSLMYHFPLVDLSAQGNKKNLWNLGKVRKVYFGLEGLCSPDSIVRNFAT